MYYGELIRPWKLITFLFGTSLLIVGSKYFTAPDWDLGVSLLMAIWTYITASWSIHILIEKKYKFVLVALFCIWFGVDGSYSLYWYVRDPSTLDMMRSTNFLPSLLLYLLCGVIWYHRGPIKNIIVS